MISIFTGSFTGSSSSSSFSTPLLIFLIEIGIGRLVGTERLINIKKLNSRVCSFLFSITKLTFLLILIIDLALVSLASFTYFSSLFRVFSLYFLSHSSSKA